MQFSGKLFIPLLAQLQAVRAHKQQRQLVPVKLLDR